MGGNDEASAPCFGMFKCFGGGGDKQDNAGHKGPGEQKRKKSAVEQQQEDLMEAYAAAKANGFVAEPTDRAASNGAQGRV
mmetsp:Transcript_34929/g.54599  ORF Transcript_34929/g.54599 Transcript_34929/m.54599 type:complete len:80 (-) Transcript_34929:451-690(-)